MRLLHQRHHDVGGGAAGAYPGPGRYAIDGGAGSPSVPLRHPSADSARGAQGGATDGGGIMSGNTLPPDLANNPWLGNWVRIAADGAIELFAGKVELGQGISVALIQIAAEELDARLPAIRLTAGHTGFCPDEAFTAGSLSVEMGGMAIRLLCAEVRRLFVQQAALRLGAEPGAIDVEDGRFSAAQRPGSLGY